MSVNKEAPASASVSGGDKVGDILKRERLTRRITIETIAKDLKLNVSYLKALEEGNYDALPVDPYVRVYIKSLSKYLSLDTESIMKQFYKERGLIVDDKSAANKIDVTVHKQEKNPTVVVAAVLIVVLAVFAFIANQKGWIAHSANRTVEVVDEKDAAADPDAIHDRSEDSLVNALSAPTDSATAARKPPPPTP